MAKRRSNLALCRLPLWIRVRAIMRQTCATTYAARMNAFNGLQTALIALALSGWCGALAQAHAVHVDGFEAPARVVMSTGGANYLWFGDDGQCQIDSRDAFGLLKRYHEIDVERGSVRRIARRQLAAMYKGGMRRLSLGVYFMHQPASGGTLIDSSDPVEVAQTARNLANLLADVKASGYEEVLFRFFPTNNINPSQPEFPRYGGVEFDLRVNEYWRLIQALRPALVNSGLAYRIDLMVEGAPRDSNNVVVPESSRYKYPANDTWSRAVRSLWQRYVAAWGANDTVGFSFIVDEDRNRLRSRVRHMRYVYEGIYPHAFAIDFYAGQHQDEYEKFLWMDQNMREQNPAGAHWDSTGWIIAEVYYEDPLVAAGLARAIRETGRTVFYLTQWPLDRASDCRSAHVNLAPPYRWRVWPAYGF